MAFLGLDFIISSLIWLLIVILFVFIFRKHLKKFFYKDISFDVFYKNLKNYLEEKYPNIKFDFSILETSKSEPNPNARKYLILDDIINQYNSLKLDSSKYPKATPQNLQWSSYIFNSEPNRNKLPSDWVQRKNALLTRDDKRCFRCSTQIDLNSIQIHMIRSLENGGKYFLENLIPMCKDCDKIINKKAKHLDIKDNLYALVKGNV
ncbi:MAG: HNH endonuclease signature motif containing protein [Campylobacterota bacterium]|nr:HNH endonuclease signature motif containing protein [Campylobacterota bacterium]